MDDFNEVALVQPPFAKFLGMNVTHVSAERVTAELKARPELNNRFGILHGGAIMALADNLGGTATTANLKEGQQTTTIESKTNFFAAIPIGDVAYAECTPCIAAAPPWSGRRASPAATAGSAPSSRRRRWCSTGASEKVYASDAAGFARAPRFASTTPTAQTTMPAIDSASSFSPNRKYASRAVTAGTR